MTPQYHLPDELLAVYAAGACSEPEALFVASHLTLCPTCRETLLVHEAVGGMVLDDVSPVAVGTDPMTVVTRTLEPTSAAAVAPAFVLEELAAAGMPRVLAPYLPEGLRWRFLVPGVKQVELTLTWHGYPVRIVRFPPSYVVPLHTHEGVEYTLCLQGAFRDSDKVWCRGDVELCDETHRHELQVTPDGPCTCLFVANAAPVPLTLLGRLLRPFLG